MSSKQLADSPPEHDETVDFELADPIDADAGLQTMGFEDKSVDDSRKTRDTLGLLAAMSAVGIMTCYTWTLVLTSSPASLSWFVVHPPFQTLAVFLFAFGITTLQSTSLAQPKAKERGFARHQLIMFYMGFPVLVAGTSAIIFNKYRHESAHFTTWHGTLGIIAVGWMVIQIAIGGGSVWYGGRAFGRNPKAIYKYHRASGYGLLSLFLLVVYVGGYWSNFSVNNGSLPLRTIAYLVCPVIALLGIVTRARLGKMQFF